MNLEKILRLKNMCNDGIGINECQLALAVPELLDEIDRLNKIHYGRDVVWNQLGEHNLKFKLALEEILQANDIADCFAIARKAIGHNDNPDPSNPGVPKNILIDELGYIRSEE